MMEEKQEKEAIRRSLIDQDRLKQKIEAESQEIEFDELEEEEVEHHEDIEFISRKV